MAAFDKVRVGISYQNDSFWLWMATGIYVGNIAIFCELRFFTVVRTCGEGSPSTSFFGFVFDHVPRKRVHQGISVFALSKKLLLSSSFCFFVQKKILSILLIILKII